MKSIFGITVVGLTLIAVSKARSETCEQKVKAALESSGLSEQSLTPAAKDLCKIELRASCFIHLREEIFLTQKIDFADANRAALERCKNNPTREGIIYLGPKVVQWKAALENQILSKSIGFQLPTAKEITQKLIEGLKSGDRSAWSVFSSQESPESLLGCLIESTSRIDLSDGRKSALEMALQCGSQSSIGKRPRSYHTRRQLTIGGKSIEYAYIFDKSDYEYSGNENDCLVMSGSRVCPVENIVVRGSRLKPEVFDLFTEKPSDMVVYSPALLKAKETFRQLVSQGKLNQKNADFLWPSEARELTYKKEFHESNRIVCGYINKVDADFEGRVTYFQMGGKFPNHTVGIKSRVARFSSVEDTFSAGKKLYENQPVCVEGVMEREVIGRRYVPYFYLNLRAKILRLSE